jgi:hypothetical protein
MNEGFSDRFSGIPHRCVQTCGESSPTEATRRGIVSPSACGSNVEMVCPAGGRSRDDRHPTVHRHRGRPNNNGPRRDSPQAALAPTPPLTRQLTVFHRLDPTYLLPLFLIFPPRTTRRRHKGQPAPPCPSGPARLSARSATQLGRRGSTRDQRWAVSDEVPGGP